MDQQTEAELRQEIADLRASVAWHKRLRLVTAQMALSEMDVRINSVQDSIRHSKKRLAALRSHVTKQQVSELDRIISELPDKI